MTYKEYLNTCQTDVNNLPIFWAFNNEQFHKACEERNIPLDGSVKLVALGGGGYCKKSDYPMIEAFLSKDPLKKLMSDYDFAFDAFYYEMGNHEYHINTYQGDWDVCSCFGDCEWVNEETTGEQYLVDMGYGADTIKAYKDARKKFLKDASDNDWY